MNKFELTKLSKLIIGDRFYFPKKKNNLCTYAGFIKTGIKIEYCYEDDNGNYYHHSADKNVVFLRHDIN